MQYVCDAPNGMIWFRIETEGEAVHESRLMSHTVEKYFRREREKAVQSWRPERPNAIERDIGLEAHVQREMPLFLSRTRPSLRWERISVSHSIATAASPTAANDVGSWTLSRRSTASAVMSDLGRTADCSCSGRAFRLMTHIGHRPAFQAATARGSFQPIRHSIQPVGYCLLGVWGGHAATRVYRACWRRGGGLAARGARTAAVDPRG